MVSIKMHNLLVEKRTLNKEALSLKLAQDIQLSGVDGKVAVVADHPAALLSSTRKQWFRLMRQVQRKRSATIGVSRISSLASQVSWMQNLTFTAKLPDDLLIADVTFATANDFVRLAPLCHTLYVTYSFEREKLYMLTSWMAKGGRVVIYE
jgi:hypothetical protein